MYYQVPGVCGPNKYLRPAFCPGCGKAYPWTEKAMEAAKQLVDGTGTLSSDEKIAFNSNINVLVRNSPEASVAAVTIKNFLSKAGVAIASALKDILIGVISETVRKTIWP